MKSLIPKFYMLSLCMFLIISLVNTKPCISTNIDSLQSVLSIQTGNDRLETLILLGRSYTPTDRKKSIDIYKEAYSMVGENEKNQLAEVSYQIAYNYFVMKNNDSATAYYSIAFDVYSEIKDTLNIMKTSTMRGLSYQQLGEFSSSAKDFRFGINLFAPYWKYHAGEKNISQKHIASMMTNYGISLYNMGQYDSSLYYATEAYKLNIDTGSSSKQIAKSLVNIGIAYLGAQRNQESIQYFNEAKELFTPLKDSFNIRKCYNNIGLANKQLGNISEAIANYNRSLDISRAAKDIKGISTSLINLSSLYVGQGDAIKAEKSLQEALLIGNELNDKNLISNSLQNLSNIYKENHNLKNALLFARKAEVAIEETGNIDMLKDNKLLLSNIYEEMGDFKGSLAFHKQYTTLHDSIFNAGNTERFNRLQTEFETIKKEKEIEILKVDQQKQMLENSILRNRQTTTIILFGLILIMVVIIGFIIILKRKKDKVIHRQNELFLKKEQQLSLLELERSKAKEEELNQSILYKSKQLSTHALHMMQKNTMLQDIKLDIDTMAKKAPVDDKPNYKRISQQINQSLRSDKDWDVFKLYFEDVNRNFYNKLNELNTDLTTNDHRLCALIKLNMNSKEMASVLNVAPNSIKSSRYRLKKKLGLDTDADLEEFIRNIG